MTKPKKPYTARSLKAAQARVRRLEKTLAETIDWYEKYIAQQGSNQAATERELIQLAKLAADGPAFYDPLAIAKAKQVRDRVLRELCKLDPSGNPIK